MTKSPYLRVADFLLSLAILGYGLFRLHAEWPAPTGWTWTSVVLGVLCVAAWFLNPLERIQTYLVRGLVKTKR